MGHIQRPLEVESGSIDHSLRTPVNGQAGTVEPGSAATFTALTDALTALHLPAGTVGKLVVRCDSGVLYAIPMLINS